MGSKKGKEIVMHDKKNNEINDGLNMVDNGAMMISKSGNIKEQTVGHSGSGNFVRYEDIVEVDKEGKVTVQSNEINMSATHVGGSSQVDHITSGTGPLPAHSPRPPEGGIFTPNIFTHTVPQGLALEKEEFMDATDVNASGNEDSDMEYVDETPGLVGA